MTQRCQTQSGFLKSIKFPSTILMKNINHNPKVNDCYTKVTILTSMNHFCFKKQKSAKDRTRQNWLVLCSPTMSNLSLFTAEIFNTYTSSSSICHDMYIHYSLNFPNFLLLIVDSYAQLENTP